MLHNILGEMMEYLRGNDVSCRNGSDDIEIAWRRRRWFSWTERSERVHIVTTVLEDSKFPSLAEGTSVFLSLRSIPAEMRRQLDRRGILWFDIEGKERSERSHDLGEEIAQYLRRHGLRFNRACEGKTA